jgi:hypothetical protein
MRRREFIALIGGSVIARGDQVDFRTATLHIRRVKQGTPSTHVFQKL